MSELGFYLDSCSVVRLTQEHAPELQSLFERCSDYVEIISGAPPGPNEAEEELRSGPRGKELADKFALGIYQDEGSLIGYLDLIRDYPQEREWWLGLLMLDPAARSQGLGSRIYEAVAQWVGSQGGRTIGIGVLEANPEAERFWRRQGFVEVRRQPFAADSGKAHTMIVLRHELGGDPPPLAGPHPPSPSPACGRGGGV